MFCVFQFECTGIQTVNDPCGDAPQVCVLYLSRKEYRKAFLLRPIRVDLCARRIAASEEVLDPFQTETSQ